MQTRWQNNANHWHVLSCSECREQHEKKTLKKPLIHVIFIQISSTSAHCAVDRVSNDVFDQNVALSTAALLDPCFNLVDIAQHLHRNHLIARTAALAGAIGDHYT